MDSKSLNCVDLDICYEHYRVDPKEMKDCLYDLYHYGFGVVRTIDRNPEVIVLEYDDNQADYEGNSKIHVRATRHDDDQCGRSETWATLRDIEWLEELLPQED